MSQIYGLMLSDVQTHAVNPVERMSTPVEYSAVSSERSPKWSTKRSMGARFV